MERYIYAKNKVRHLAIIANKIDNMTVGEQKIILNRFFDYKGKSLDEWIKLSEKADIARNMAMCADYVCSYICNRGRVHHELNQLSNSATTETLSANLVKLLAKLIEFSKELDGSEPGTERKLWT